MLLSRLGSRCKTPVKSCGLGDVRGKRKWPEPVSDLQREHAAGDNGTADDGTCSAPCALQGRSQPALSAAGFANDWGCNWDGSVVTLEPSEAGSHRAGAVYTASRRDGSDCADRRVGVYDGMLRGQSAAGRAG